MLVRDPVAAHTWLRVVLNHRELLVMLDLCAGLPILQPTEPDEIQPAIFFVRAALTERTSTPYDGAIGFLARSNQGGIATDRGGQSRSLSIPWVPLFEFGSATPTRLYPYARIWLHFLNLLPP